MFSIKCKSEPFSDEIKCVSYLVGNSPDNKRILKKKFTALSTPIVRIIKELKKLCSQKKAHNHPSHSRCSACMGEARCFQYW